MRPNGLTHEAAACRAHRRRRVSSPNPIRRESVRGSRSAAGLRGNRSTSEDGSSGPCIGGVKSAPPDGSLRTHGEMHRIAGGVLQRRLKCTILLSWAPSCSRLLFAAGLVRLMQVLGQVTRPTQQELATIRGTMDTPVPVAHSRYANIRDDGHTNFGHLACGALPILTRARARTT